MRVERLDLHAYGHYEGAALELSEPPAGLTVVWGPNEAGKSTARRALLAALFGFERDDPGAYRHGRHGLRLGASLVSADGRRLTFVREGQSKCVDEHGDHLDEALVGNLCGEVDRQLCTRLFSIGHEELRAGSEALLEADGEIGRLVYGASLGAGSVAAVLRGLDERAAKLFQERGKAQRIPRALQSYREQMREAKASRVRSRDWDQRRQAVEEAAERRHDVRRAFEQARAQAARLEQIRVARPLLARRSSVMAALSGLGEVASEEWADRADKALVRYRDGRAASELACGRHERLEADVARIEVPGALLERAGRIDRLVEGIDRYRKDTEDLPKRRSELQAADDAVAEQLQVLGLVADDGRVVAEADLATVEALVRDHVELMAEGRTARDELARVTDQVATARDRLADLPEAIEVTGLERVLRLARPKLDAVDELAAARATQSSASERLAAASRRLGLGGLSLAAVEALAVPRAGEVDAERTRRAASRFDRTQLAADRERLDARLQSERAESARLGTSLPDPERLGAAREHRDAGWQVVRYQLEGGAVVDATWAAGARLADAYEQAVCDADEAADERSAHASEMALLEDRRSQIARLEGELAELAEREVALDAADCVGGDRWHARWAAIGVEAGEPDDMGRWLADHDGLVEGLAAWRDRTAELDAATAELDRQAVVLAVALAETGQAPCGEALDLLVAQAEEIVAGVNRAREARRDAAVALRLAEEAEPARASALERHAAEVARWQDAWSAALHPLSLAATVTPEAAGVAVAAHRSLVAARTQRRSLARRIEGIEDDRRSYVEQVDDVADGFVADGVLAPGRGGGPLEVVPLLQQALADARAAEERKRTLAGQLDEALDLARRADDELVDARLGLAALREESGMVPSPEAPDEGVDLVVCQAREAASLRAKRAELERDLAEQADGSGIDALEAASEAAGEALAGTIAGAHAEVEAQTKRLEEASEALAEAERALRDVTGAAVAADLEQDAQGELALAAELSSEYATVALAAEILRRTIRDYGERHRGPILTRASELFGDLTGGAFAELVADADGERHVLLARRLGGELCTAAALSDGARDQLYLALRLAGLEHQLAATAEPPPVVLDDVLVHFDDRRAAAAIRALGELGRRTQTLLFTHHERVVELAEAELGAGAVAVVRLPPRDHGQPPAGPAPAPGAVAAGRDAVAERLLAAARDAGGPARSKAELLELSGIAEAAWPAAVRALVERGALVQEGQKRGARYRVAGAP